MSIRIAVPLVAVALLAAPAFGAGPSPKPSPATSPATISSPKPSPTPAKHAASKHRARKVVATARPSARQHSHVLTPTNTAAPNGVAK